MTEGALKKTPLYDEHVRLGAKMIPFGDWIMPVQYSGIIFPHRLVFIDDATVLHRHDPIAERDHLRAEPHMLVVERRLFWRGLGHGRHPRCRDFCVNAGALR